MWAVKRLRENEDFELSILLLEFSGLWPLRADARKTYLDKLREAGIVLTLVFGVLASIILLPLGAFMSTNDLLKTIKEVIAISFCLLTIAKIGCLYFQKDKVKTLTSNIMESKRRDMANNPSFEKQKVVAKVQKWINAFVVITVVAIVQISVGYCSIIPSLVSTRKHFVSFWFPIDPYSTPTYEIIFLIFVTTILIGVVANSSVDSFLAAILFQVVGQFRLLRHDIKKIREHAVKNVRRSRKQQEAENLNSEKHTLDGSQEVLSVKTLKKKALELDTVLVEEEELSEEMTVLLEGYVYRYQECIEFVREVERLFDPLISTQIVVSVVSLLALIFFVGIDPAASNNVMNAIEKENLRAEHKLFVMVIVSILGAVYSELGCCCYLTDLITEESEAVRDAVYDCDWLESTESFKKSMRIVMSRANQPVFVRAAGFIPLTHETYMGITNLAFSYYTTLNAAVNERHSF